MHRGSGSRPLVAAALHDEVKIAELLISSGADVNGQNRDGNTPLHVAAFLCHQRLVKLLLNHDASTEIRSVRGERPVDTVLGDWSPELAGLYQFIGHLTSQDLDVEVIRQARPTVAALLQ